MKFCFGDIVVVENNLIGVVVKSWINPKNISVSPRDREVRHEVYVRYFNEIREYPEDLIERYMVRHKYLEGEEITWQNNAINNTIEALDEPLTDKEKEIIRKLIEKNPLNISSREYKEGWNTTIGTIVYDLKPTSREKILGVRSYNAFLRSRIYTLQDFFNKEPYEIRKIKNLGEKSLSYMIKAIFNYCNDHNIKTRFSLKDYGI